jgi:hypothetical protein
MTSRFRQNAAAKFWVAALPLTESAQGTVKFATNPGLFHPHA